MPSEKSFLIGRQTMRASVIFICNWQSGVLLKRSEWTRHVVTRRGHIRTLRRMIQNLEVQLPAAQLRLRENVRCVRSDKFRLHSAGGLPTSALAVPFTGFGTKETFPTACSLSQADPIWSLKNPGSL